MRRICPEAIGGRGKENHAGFLDSSTANTCSSQVYICRTSVEQATSRNVVYPVPKNPREKRHKALGYSSLSQCQGTGSGCRKWLQEVAASKCSHASRDFKRISIHVPDDRYW